MKKWLEIEVVRYIISGTSAVATDFMSYLILYELFKINVSVSKGISYVLGAFLAFLINKLWTFETAKAHKTHIALLKFGLLYGFSFSLNVLINAVVLDITQITIFAFGFATGTSIVVNYLGQKFWVFKKSNG
ncbi:GtrA family protein [Fusibacter bizertensis]